MAKVKLGNVKGSKGDGDLYVETPGADPATAWELDGDGNLYVKTGA